MVFISERDGEGEGEIERKRRERGRDRIENEKERVRDLQEENLKKYIPFIMKYKYLRIVHIKALKVKIM